MVVNRRYKEGVLIETGPIITTQRRYLQSILKGVFSTYVDI